MEIIDANAKSALLNHLLLFAHKSHRPFSREMRFYSIAMVPLVQHVRAVHTERHDACSAKRRLDAGASDFFYFRHLNTSLISCYLIMFGACLSAMVSLMLQFLQGFEAFSFDTYTPSKIHIHKLTQTAYSFCLGLRPCFANVISDRFNFNCVTLC